MADFRRRFSASRLVHLRHGQIGSLVVILSLFTTSLCALDQTMASVASEDQNLPDFDALWDYSDPTAMRAQFESIRTQNPDAPLSYRLQLLTQIARTQGLESDFDAAHALLDEVEAALAEPASVEGVRYLLERGRAFRSGGAADKAQPLFEAAFEVGQQVGDDYHSIDAAHMVAITVDSTEVRRDWSHKGIAIAEASSQPRARHWLGPIYNNLGWDYHEAGELDTSLDLFQKALVVRVEEEKPGPISIARWCVARCMRSLDRHAEALTIQQQLAAEHEAAGTEDGYVSEELGELHLALGDAAQAAAHFAEAYRLLSQDSWLVKNEADRLARLQKLGRAP